ncbi:hypothetical protein BDQ12DRAFT_681013 [Crucibulum laeve]|uniref:Carboxylic ester hydrolase n=1 Tax=Crucibulum laeve TaxID=68775 RepID=A0A5C3MET4_9AGAR|nr:hypothetical protein BDQ12DRAFT_681013 [Crucibulum laeve]
MNIDGIKSLSSDSPNNRFLVGRTPFFASTFDQRFSFGLYIPLCHSSDGIELPLLVIVHGTRRQTGGYLNRLKDFSENHHCAILCPLFPAGIIDPDDIHNYKNMCYQDIRFDLVLLSMIEQASKRWRLKIDKFFLHGFSGGGQFAHRFFYLHPERLAAVSIGAPGRITSPSQEEPWPAGLCDIQRLFQISNIPNYGAMGSVPVQFVVGERDVHTKQLASVKTPSNAEREAGGNRVDRMGWLKNAWAAVGIQTEMTIVPKVGHDGLKCLPHVESWLKPLVDAASC